MNKEIMSNVIGVVGFIVFNVIIYAFFNGLVDFSTGFYDTMRNIGAALCVIGLPVVLISAALGKSKEKS